MELGFPEGITPEKPAPYRMEKPVLFYGSSITQGGCASRPGNCCSAMVSRLLDCMIWNLGFSGNAKGEAELAEYIANVPLGAMVYDYDHNAPSADHLERTHLPFLRTILEKQPELPVVIVSRPDYISAAFTVRIRSKFLQRHQMHQLFPLHPNAVILCANQEEKAIHTDGDADNSLLPAVQIHNAVQNAVFNNGLKKKLHDPKIQRLLFCVDLQVDSALKPQVLKLDIEADMIQLIADCNEIAAIAQAQAIKP